MLPEGVVQGGVVEISQVAAEPHQGGGEGIAHLWSTRRVGGGNYFWNKRLLANTITSYSSSPPIRGSPVLESVGLLAKSSRSSVVVFANYTHAGSVIEEGRGHALSKNCQSVLGN